MSDVRSILSRVPFESVGNVLGMVLAIQEHELFFYVCDFESGFFENDDNFPFVDFVFFSEMDDLS